jgi:hypothetical protein
MKNKKTNAPNILRLLAIIALVAVIGFSTASCSIIPDDDGGGGGGTTNLSLDGVWKAGNTIITISGSTGVVTQLPTTFTGYTQDAINKGYYGVGKQLFRNLTKTGDLTWTGQYLLITRNSSSPDVATGTTWGNCTITMNANGQTFENSYENYYGTNNDTWTRQ